MSPAGCQYKLEINLKTDTRGHNCTRYIDNFSFTMTPTDRVYINLLKDKDTTSGFKFDFEIKTETNGPKLNLTCRSSWTKPLVTTQTTTTVGGNSLQSDSTTGTSLTSTPETTQTTATVGGNSLQSDSTTGTSLTSTLVTSPTTTTVGGNSLQSDSTTGTSLTSTPETTQTTTTVGGNSLQSDSTTGTSLTSTLVTSPTTTTVGGNSLQSDSTTGLDVYSSLDSRYNTSGDLKPYEHLPKQENSLTEHQEDVPHIDNDYDIVVEGSSPENEIELNTIPPNNRPDPRNNTSSDYRPYEHLPKQEKDITKQQEHVSELQEDVLFTNNDYIDVVEDTSPYNEIE
ncbi:hypothetical protein LOTGIDRAFT_175938 [Lottia gigantea]|uniref:CUB domain-containing protein n=1 Tax=Lottia gigantea TaxID=225164 RepID=V4A2W2_LOTGI|nr:hypothetical protein LOTGIDRAFT_175938 [Lottia gigantea]ESO87641.1 hypothetical protein LOTGIDRAFT_175938 [Lottia gigantea]